MKIEIGLTKEGNIDKIGIKTPQKDMKFINTIKDMLDYPTTHRKWDGSQWTIDLTASKEVISFLLNIGYSKEADILTNLINKTKPEVKKEVLTIMLENKAKIPNLRQIFNKHSDWKKEIRNELGIKINPMKVKMIKRKNPQKADWDGIILPSVHYDWNNNFIFVDKAYTLFIANKLKKLGYAIEIENLVMPIPLIQELKWNFGHDLRDCQENALEYLKKTLPVEYGASFQLPTACGKTIVIIKLIFDWKLSTIVLVDTRDLLYQWKKELKRVLGVEIGMIGDGIFDPKQITVATVQSIWNYVKNNKTDENGDVSQKLIESLIEKGEIEDDYSPITNADFFKQFSIVDLDEMHIGAADTYLKCLQTFTAMYFVGQSATTWRTDRMEKMTEGILGKVGYVFSRKEAEEKGYISKANINIIKGIKTENRDDSFQTALKEITHSEDRNNTIAEIVKKCPKPCLIMTDRVNHQNNIAKALRNNGIGYTIIKGETKTNEREIIKNKFGKNEISVIISTIWKKGTDIPSIASLIMAYPTKSDVNTIQMIGRALRLSEGKKIAEVFDIQDWNNEYIENWTEERMDAYWKEGWMKNIDKGMCKYLAYYEVIGTPYHKCERNHKKNPSIVNKDGNYQCSYFDDCRLYEPRTEKDGAAYSDDTY
jgi:superfamily II DNA or RNA helicase